MMVDFSSLDMLKQKLESQVLIMFENSCTEQEDWTQWPK